MVTQCLRPLAAPNSRPPKLPSRNRTKYAYDPTGNRTRIDDAEAHSTYFAYDLLGRLAGEHDAIGKAESYDYDPTGNLTARTDGDDQTTYYAYDPLGRQSRIDFPEGVAAYFAHDPNGNLVAAWDDAGGEADTFVYDELDRVTARTIDGVGTLYFEYDLAGRRTLIKDWEGKAVYYTYDKRGLIASVHSHAGWAHYTYDARGAVLTRKLPNGSCTYHAYDAAGRVASIADRKSDGATICSFDFGRDPNGNILTSLREDQSCWYYAYDGLQRLTGAEWKESEGASLYAYDYQYDKVGNRSYLLSNGSHTYYTYNAANELTHEVTLGGEVAYYTYDGRGNQTERRVLGGDTVYFEYDSRDLITRIDSTDAGFTPNTFGYSALGQRIRKTDSTGTTYYVWDGLNITHEHDGSGAVTRRYTHGHTPIHGVFSLISVQDRQGCRYCYHMDQVGGIHRLTDAWGNVIKTYEFSPFGRMLEETGNAPNVLGLPGNHMILRDVPWLRLSAARVYDPCAGRALQRDMLPKVERGVTLAQGALSWFGRDTLLALLDCNWIRQLFLPGHAYELFAGNAVRHVDPSGLEYTWYDKMLNFLLTGDANATSGSLQAGSRGWIRGYWKVRPDLATAVVVDPARPDPHRNMSLAQLAYTGRLEASEEDLAAATSSKAMGDYVNCYNRCLKCVPLRTRAPTGSVLGSFVLHTGLPKWLAEKILRRALAGAESKSTIRLLGILLRRAGFRGLGNTLLRHAAAFKAAKTMGRAARIAVVAAALLAIYAAQKCARACNEDPCYECDKDKKESRPGSEGRSLTAVLTAATALGRAR